MLEILGSDLKVTDSRKCMIVMKLEVKGYPTARIPCSVHSKQCFILVLVEYVEYSRVVNDSCLPP